MKQQTAWMPVTAIAVLINSMVGVEFALAAKPTMPNEPIGLPNAVNRSAERSAPSLPDRLPTAAIESPADRTEEAIASLAGGDERLHSEEFADDDPPSSLALKRKGAGVDGATHKASAAFAKETQPIRTKTSQRSPWLGVKTSGIAGTAHGYTKGVLSLAIVLALIGFTAYGVRRWLPGVKRLRSAGLDILGQTYLSPKQSVAIVRMGRHLVMIGITPERITRLAVVQDPGEVAEVLVQLKTGERLPAEDKFDPALYHAEQAFTDSEWEQEDDTRPGSSVDEYGKTRGQMRSLLRKVRLLTGNRRVG